MIVREMSYHLDDGIFREMVWSEYMKEKGSKGEKKTGGKKK